MSPPDQTNIPTSRRQNDSRAQTTTHAPTRPDSASYEQQLTQLDQLIRRRTPLSEIEQWIDRTPLTDEEKSALWLYAWSLTDIGGQRRARRDVPVGTGCNVRQLSTPSQRGRLPVRRAEQENRRRGAWSRQPTSHGRAPRPSAC